MASRSLGELWLRPSTVSRISPPICRHSTHRGPPVWTCRRTISNTTRPAAQAQPKESDDYPASPAAPARPPPAHQPQPTTATSFPKITSSPTAGGFPRRSPYAAALQSSSHDDMRAARASNSRTFGAGSFSNGIRERPPLRPGLQFAAGDMVFPADITDPSRLNKPSEAASLKQQQDEAFAVFPRMNATYGRTVDLDEDKGRDIARGLSMLGSLVTRNRIRADGIKQRYHERPGLRRKRLASERWRARFKKGFQQVTSRVSELTRKGW